LSLPLAPPGATPPAVALVGTTASGKSSVAMTVARELRDVEIVCVDSMTVYRGMDIGTAKPSAADREAVRHHLLDLADPAEEFTVRRFQEAARSALADIAARSRRALLVGGTGLYLRAVVDDLEIPARYPDVVAALEAEADAPDGLSRLYERLRALDPVAAGRTTPTNRRRIVRALEVTIGSGRPFSSYGPGLGTYGPSGVTMIGLPFDPAETDRRIEARFARWVHEGLVDEVRALAANRDGLSRTARQALGYKELLVHVVDGVELETCVARAVQRTRAFARRQWSWFRRDPRVRWVGSAEDAVAVVAEALAAPGEETSAAAVGPHGRRTRGARL